MVVPAALYLAFNARRRRRSRLGHPDGDRHRLRRRRARPARRAGSRLAEGPAARPRDRRRHRRHRRDRRLLHRRPRAARGSPPPPPGSRSSWCCVGRGCGIRPSTSSSGLAVWLCTLESGVHATIAGVALGLLTPARPSDAELEADRIADRALSRHRRRPPPRCGTSRSGCAESVLGRRAAGGRAAPVDQLPGRARSSPSPTPGSRSRSRRSATRPARAVTLGVVVGLVVGKMVGISVFAWLAVRLGLGRLPDGVGCAPPRRHGRARRHRLHGVAVHRRAGLRRRRHSATRPRSACSLASARRGDRSGRPSSSRGPPPLGSSALVARAARAGRPCVGGPRRVHRRCAACGCRRTGERAGSRPTTPPAPWAWMARSITRNAMFGTATLIAAISVKAPLAPWLSISQAALSVSRRACSMSMRLVGDPLLDHALLGKRTAEGDARSDPPAHRSRARSAAPIVRMQWWMRPGPRRAWAMANPPPSSPRRFEAGTRHVVEARARSGPPGRGSRTRAATRTTSRPGVSSGTRTIDCCRCGAASGSVLPITMASAQSFAGLRP